MPLTHNSAQQQLSKLKAQNYRHSDHITLSCTAHTPLLPLRICSLRQVDFTFLVFLDCIQHIFLLLLSPLQNLNLHLRLEAECQCCSLQCPILLFCFPSEQLDRRLDRSVCFSQTPVVALFQHFSGSKFFSQILLHMSLLQLLTFLPYFLIARSCFAFSDLSIASCLLLSFCRI